MEDETSMRMCHVQAAMMPAGTLQASGLQQW
jgi:hypothetical protein